jgi:hypothetical protein
LLAIYALNLHVNPVRFRAALILTDAEGLTTLRSTLVDNSEFAGWMLLKEIAKNKFCLGFAIRLGTPIQRNIDSLIQEF